MLHQIIRSEAQFAAMLFSDLRVPGPFRARFLGLVSEQAGVEVGDVEDIFVEPAPSRDAWWFSTDQERWRLIETLLHWANPEVDAAQIDSMFVEVNDTLRSPATWDKAQMLAAAPEVLRLRYIFRARPDLLVITNSHAIWMELKVESKTQGW